MRGKDKGKTGLVIATLPKKNKVMVEGINQFKKHQKGDVKGRGELVTITKPIDVSKVMLLDPETGKKTKVGYIIEDGKKYRISKTTKNKLVNKVKQEIVNEQDSKPGKNAGKTKGKEKAKKSPAKTKSDK